MADQTTTLAKVDAFRAEVAALGGIVPPAPSNAIAGTLVRTDQYAPKATPAGQTFVLSLHGSGGPQLAFGDQWTATVDEPYADHAMPMTWAAQGKADGIYLQPHDKYWRTPTAFFESYWLGCAVGTDLRLYTEKRLDELMRQVTAQYPGASATKRVASGGSMGAWGCMSYALRRPAMFAAVFASRPRWKWEGKAVTTSTGGVVYVDTLTTNGAPAAQHLDAIAYVSNPANAVPFAVWCVGRRDGFSAFADHVAAVQAMRATGRGFAFAWNDGDHSGGDILGSLGYLYNQFELGVGYPVLTNCSHDKDPAIDLVGTINAGFTWRNVVETPTAWSCEITNTQATTVTVRPKSSVFTASVTPKVITIAAGLYAAVSFAAAVPPPPAVTAPIVSRTVLRPKAIIMAALLPDLSGHTLVIGFSDGNRYLRMQKPVELAGQTTANPQGVGPTATIRGFIETTAAPQLTFGAAWTASVTLTPMQPAGAPIVVASVAVAATATTFDAPVTLAPLAEGWYMASVTGMPAGWAVLPWAMYVRHSATAQPQTHTPVITGSWTHEHTHRVSYAMVPAQFQPTMVPLPARTYPANTTIAKPIAGQSMNEMAKLAYTMLAPFKVDDVYRPSVLPSGVWTTANAQRYFASSYSQAEPPWSLLDGPRGRGCIACPTSLRESARPTGGKVLFTDPWRVGTVGDNGTVHTEAGYVHDEPPVYPLWDFFAQQRAPSPRRLVGDWSGIPVLRHGFHELWDVAVDARTTGIDVNAPSIGNPPEPPHVMPIQKYVTDTRNGRVCRLTYAPNDLTRTATVTEFVAGLSLPWGCECVDNLLIVTVSGAGVAPTGNCINAYDMGPPDAPLAVGTLVWSVPFTRPEGIRVVDRVAYIGSLPSKAVMAMPIDARVISKFCDVPTDGNSGFINVAAAKDVFTAGINVATTTWSSGQYGWPCVFGPDGKRLAIGDRDNSWGEPKGMYLPNGLSYASCVSLGANRMTWGTVQEGLHRVSAALPTDAVVPAAVKAGAQKAYDLDLRQVWSDLFFGFYGVPLPWGVYGPDVDALMANMGHTQ